MLLPSNHRDLTTNEHGGDFTVEIPASAITSSETKNVTYSSIIHLIQASQAPAIICRTVSTTVRLHLGIVWSLIARKKRKRRGSQCQSTVPVNLRAHAPLHSETGPPGCVTLISAGVSPYRCSQFSHRCGVSEKFLFGSCLWQID